MNVNLIHKITALFSLTSILLPFQPLLAIEKDEIGVVIMAVGQVSAQSASGVIRQLQRRSSVFEKELLITGTDARAQIRFTDGSLVSLQQNSRLKIDSYSFKRSEQKDNAAYDLLKGGMRTISGAIGKTNHVDYKVSTPVATIGIRGTDYELILHDNTQSGSTELYGYINEGVINVANDGGDANFGFNQFFAVVGPLQPPMQLLTPPEFMFEGYVPPQGRHWAGDSASNILNGNSTGLETLFADNSVSLPNITTPSVTPFSTVSRLTGQFTYSFDTSSSGGPLPNVSNGPAAKSATSSLHVDFTTQEIMSGSSVNVTLTDNTTLYGSSGAATPLADVLVNGQSVQLTGSCSGNCVSATSGTAAGTLTLQFIGDAAKEAVGSYTLGETSVTNGISVTGTAVYSQGTYQPAM